ncbi:dimethylaniline monooxygenase [Stachybotrys elegans]|uniref:Dimethylaniline monooxygenase n=1 Tax=Stachybotrys elegans TaxID=80388 RepID=A0A8K0STV9_9HYPO|nr:dimethylaniline monooxygenase [Stachybotrys elegans]
MAYAPMKVAIIGGGPAGLATLKFLVTAHNYFPIPPIEARLFESRPSIGGTFAYHVYEDAELVSSKYLTAFSDFRLPPDAPDFVTPEDYVNYLHRYVAWFSLGCFIECGTRVTGVRRAPKGPGHIVSLLNGYREESEWLCDAVAVCSGLNGTPCMPDIPGIERVPTVLHSSRLKLRQQFGKDTNVVVLGAGETSMDIAHLAVTSPTASVTICHREGWFCGPKIVPVAARGGHPPKSTKNKPVDTSVCSLFDTAYTHPTLQRSPLPWFVYDKWVKGIHWLISGTPEGPDQWAGQMSKSRKHLDSIFLCKSNRALPYISAGRRSESWWNRLRSSILNVPLLDTGGKKIDVARWPTHVDQHGFMHFGEPEPGEHIVHGGSIKPDVVVCATGYNAESSYLGNDYYSLDEADIYGICSSNDKSVGYIGFVRPSIGAMPPLAELQAQLWVLLLLQDAFSITIPRDPRAVAWYELDYKMHARGGRDLFATKRAVDHESYAYQLALAIGSAPTLSYILSKGPKLAFTWAFGSNFNTKFRLVGPWGQEPISTYIMENELYNVVRQTGGLVYIVTYTILPFLLFGSISLGLYAVDYVKNLCSGMAQYFMSQLNRQVKGKRHLM